jgi:hypothetical protein
MWESLVFNDKNILDGVLRRTPVGPQMPAAVTSYPRAGDCPVPYNLQVLGFGRVVALHDRSSDSTRRQIS